MKEYNNHTFVVCAYKESQYLEDCINSLLNQRVKSNILIATSTPNPYIYNIAKKYNIEVFVNNGDHGIGQDWNFAVSKAKTDYVTVAHQDDIYNEDYLEEIVKKLEQNNDFIIAFSDYNEIKNGEVIPLTKNLKIKKILLLPLRMNNKSSFSKWFSLAFGSAICCPAVTVNTKVLGKKPYITDLKCDLDWDSWYNFSKYKGRFLYISKPLMKHRIHEESETSNLIENNIRLDEDFIMFKKFWPNWVAKFLMKYYKKAINTNSIK